MLATPEKKRAAKTIVTDPLPMEDEVGFWVFGTEAPYWFQVNSGSKCTNRYS
jgi:hypothetical protein